MSTIAAGHDTVPLEFPVRGQRIAAILRIPRIQPAARATGAPGAPGASGVPGIVLTGPRVYYSMARDGFAPRWLGHVDPRFETPTHAIAAQAAWASVLAATGVYRQLVTRVIYTEWLFFALMAAGLFVLRRRRGYRAEYRTWGYPIVPAVFIAVSLAIVINQFIVAPREAAVGLGLVALGAPVYYMTHAHRRLS